MFSGGIKRVSDMNWVNESLNYNQIFEDKVKRKSKELPPNFMAAQNILKQCCSYHLT